MLAEVGEGGQRGGGAEDKEGEQSAGERRGREDEGERERGASPLSCLRFSRAGAGGWAWGPVGRG